MDPNDILTDDELDAMINVNDEQDELDGVSDLLSDIGLEDGDTFDLLRKRAKSAKNAKLQQKLQAQMMKNAIRAQKRNRGMTLAQPALLMPQMRNAGLEAVATQNAYQGWIVPYLMQAFQANSYVVPISGIERMTPLHNLGGFRAPSWPAFWAQLIQSLDSGSDRTTKSTAGATAVAGNITNALLSTRSIGSICHLTDSLQAGDQRPFRVIHFTNFAAGNQLEYLITPKKGSIASWLAISVEGDRGGGVPTSANAHNIRVAADGIRPGSILTVESVNYREIEK